MSLGHFSGQHFQGLSSPVANPCDRPAYATRADVELLFGSSNVAKWADLNNDEDASDIAARVCWALAESYAYMNNRLNGGPYTVPFSSPNDEVISMSARYAGVILYDTRGITDAADPPQHQLSKHRDMVEMFIKQVLAGRVRLTGEEHAVTSPAVVK